MHEINPEVNSDWGSQWGFKGEVSSEEHLVTERRFVRGKVDLSGGDSLTKGPKVGRMWEIQRTVAGGEEGQGSGD